MDNSGIEKLLRLPEEDWIEIVLALRFHAELRIRRYTWNASRNGLPRGWTADDVVFEAIASVLDGTRTIDPDCRDIVDALRSIVDSKLNALVQTMEHRTTVHAQDGDPVAEFYPGSLDESGTAAEGEDRLDELLEAVRSGMAPELVPVLEEMVDGYRPGEIAIRLGVPVETIYVLVRRVRAHVARTMNRKDD